MTGMSRPEIRDTALEDLAALEALYPAAFPDEDLLPLVRGLLVEPAGLISLGAYSDGDLIGHVIFTHCTAGGAPVGLLAPLGVHPDWQRGGIGSALVHEGIARMRSEGVRQVCVLGDPGYYGRFGFAAEAAIEPPYRLPPEWAGAWQSVLLEGEPLAGTLTPPAPFRDPALWLP